MQKTRPPQTRFMLLRFLLQGLVARQSPVASVEKRASQGIKDKSLYYSFTPNTAMPLPAARPRITKPVKSYKLASEMRHAPRHRLRLRAGKLANFTGRVLGDCLIHDKSQTGACVRIINRAPLPLDFALYEEDIDCITPVRLVWRSGKSLGLCFLNENNTLMPDKLDSLKQKLRRTFFKAPC